MSYILVTGSNGFIAENLIEKLLNKKYKVIGLSTNDNNERKSKNYKHIKIDITNFIELEKVFKNYSISIVIHLAAIAHLKGRSNIDWNKFYRVNTLASKSIFKLAKQFDVDVFYASTVDVYGDIKAANINENSKTNPKSDYARSKYLAEQILEKELGSSSKYIIARFAPVYAPNFMKDIFKRAYISYPRISYKIGDGYNYHFASINNIIEFIITWINLENKTSGIYNICDNQPVNINELLLYEKKNVHKTITIYLPYILIPTLDFFIKLTSKIFKSNKLEKLHMNLYKLIKPPKYSNEKMRTIYDPYWNLKNTVYEIKSNDNNFT